MKSSKKFMTRVLTAALALSMVAGTGVCAAAVEGTDYEEEPVLVLAPDDGEETDDVEVPGYLVKLQAVKAMLADVAQSAYAKFSQSAAAQLVEAAQKVKMAEQIMAEVSSQVTQIKTEVSEKAVEIGEKAQALAAQMEDPEQAAQVLKEAEEQIAQMVQEAEAQIEQLVTEAQQTSEELFAQATAQVEAVKAQLKEKTSQRVSALMGRISAIQQTIAEAKAQLKEAVGQKVQALQQFTANTLQYVVEKTTQVAYTSEGDFDYQIRTNHIFGINFAVAIAYHGEDEEVTVPAYIWDVPVQEVFLNTSQEVKTVNLPATIINVTGVSFVETKGLENINVDEENPYLKSVDGILFSKDGFSLIAVPQSREYNAPEGIAEIGKEAYFMSKMSSVKIPSTVRSIGENAFFGCENLAELKIPINVIYIGENAFLNTADGFTIYCDAFSYPAAYAKEKGIKCVEALNISVGIDYEEESAFENDTMPLGTSVYFGVNAGGGSGEYTYACYYRRDNTAKWTTKQGFKDNNEFTMTPGYAGTYEVCFKVKDSKGTVKKIYASFTVEQAFENVSSISADTIKKGETVAVTCGTNIDAPTAYAVYYKKVTDTKWTTKQDYDENSEVVIKPLKAADYIICVKAKNLNDGTISKKYFDVKVNA